MRKPKKVTPDTGAAAKRKAHFANGGTARQWMPPTQNMGDKRKQQSKNACRGKVQW